MSTAGGQSSDMKLERTPIKRPPTIAPQNDPIPPTMTMTNVSTIHCDERLGCTA
jgi:hypothetical protein